MRARTITAAFLLVGGVLGAATALAAGEPEPPAPPWVLPGGAVDMSKLPRQIPVLDSTGRVVGNVDPRTFVNDVPDGTIEVGPSATPSPTPSGP